MSRQHSIGLRLAAKVDTTARTSVADVGESCQRSVVDVSTLPVDRTIDSDMRGRRSIRSTILSALLLFCPAASASPTYFLGSHPIPKRGGGGYCYVEGRHVHPYEPVPHFLFQEVDRQYVFTGDPVPFGYDRERHVFYGHHPITTQAGGAIVYCFLDGAHYHAFAAPDKPDFVVKDGVAFYVGLFSSYFFHLEGQLRQAVNEFYRPYSSYRPAVDVAPPPEWRDDLRLPPSPAPAARLSERKVLRRFHRGADAH